MLFATQPMAEQGFINLQINTKLMLRLMRQPLQSWQSTEYANNRLSLFQLNGENVL